MHESSLLTDDTLNLLISYTGQRGSVSSLECLPPKTTLVYGPTRIELTLCQFVIYPHR